MNIRYIIPSVLSLLAFAGCSDNKNEPDGDGISRRDTYLLSGKVEKGPFVRGSAISVQPLDASMTSTGSVFNGEIRDDDGSFDLGQIELESQFVRIAADGYYFNEVSGNLSTGQLHLIALADLSDRSTVNANILTHLKAARILKLRQGGMSFAEADKQAQAELFAQFGLQKYNSLAAESMSVSAGTDGSGVLIAISSLILVDRSDAEITRYLSVLSQDLADDGAFTDDNRRTISHDIYHLKDRLENISDNIISRYSDIGRTITVPDLRYFFDWNGDGIAGNEIIDNVSVTLSKDEITFDHNGGIAVIQVTSNIPLTLERYRDPEFPDTPPVVVPDETYGDFFISSGDPIAYEASLENDILTLKVDKSMRHHSQTANVYLYDMTGSVQADVKVTLGGNPDIPVILGETGKHLVRYSFERFAKALSWMYYIERGYTGMYEYYDLNCPIDVHNQFNRRAFSAAYASVLFNTHTGLSLESKGMNDASPYFHLLNAIIYTEMTDKWGHIGITGLSGSLAEVPQQETPETTLRYIASMLDKIRDCFNERDGLVDFDENEAFAMSADVWRMAKANVCMALGQPSQAMPYLQEIVDGSRHSLSSGNEYEANSGTILHIHVPEEVMRDHTISYYSYADVLLLLAECHLAAGNKAKAESFIRQVADAKNIKTSGSCIDDIDMLRRQLFMPRYFAFQKRNSLGGYEPYQHLWPIPGSELDRASSWTQNPGY